MRVVSWFAGIGGFDLAFRRAGHEVVGACEINPFARQVYEARLGAPAWFPTDINEVKPDEIPEADLWCGGSPCQGFSIAGRKEGLADDRSGLARVWFRLIAERLPRWIWLENVPGILDVCSCAICVTGAAMREDHTAARGRLCDCRWCKLAGELHARHRGRDFGELLAALDELGYGIAWASLDAQYAGVAQRRERVFALGHLGDGADPGAVLLEPAGVRRHPAPRKQARANDPGAAAPGAGGGGVAGTVTSGCRHTAGNAGEIGQIVTVPLLANGARIGADEAAGGQLVATATGAGWWKNAAEDGVRLRAQPGGTPENIVCAVATAVRARDAKGSPDSDATQTLIIEGDSAASTPRLPRLRAGCGRGGETAILQPVAFNWQAGGSIDRLAVGAKTSAVSAGQTPAVLAPTVTSRQGKGPFTDPANDGIVPVAGSVRRLTPTEAERLQGFPDGHTCLCGCEPYTTAACRCPDGPRYHVLGNAVAVPVVDWLARRLPEDAP